MASTVSDLTALAAAAQTTTDLLYVVDVSAGSLGSKKMTLADFFTLPDSLTIKFGTGSDVTMTWDGTDFDLLVAADDSVINVGNGTLSADVKVFGNTTADFSLWDASANTLFLQGDSTLVVGHSAQLTVSDGDGTTNLIPETQVIGTTKADSSVLIAGFNTTNDATVAPTLAFLKSGHATAGSNTTVAADEVLGEIIFYGADGTDFESPAARIQCAVDATVGTGDMPGRLVLSTTADAGETLTEALRIDSAQRLIQGAAAAQTISNGDGTTSSLPVHQILGTTKATASLLLGSFSATDTTTVAPSLNFVKGGGAVGAFTAVSSGEVLGEINFFGADGTDYKSPAARIACLVDAAVGTGDMPGSLVFSTSIDAGEVLTTALTINNVQTVTASKGLVAKSSTAAAITTARTLTAADSGGIFSVAKTSAYAIALPTPAQGIRFKFMVLDTGAFAVTISNASAHLFGLVSVGNTNTAMTGTTLSLVATGAVGDWVEFCGIDATHYLVTGACITAAKITIA